MLMINADCGATVSDCASGQIAVILQCTHPLTGKTVDCAGFVLSPHQALLLSAQLQRFAKAVISPLPLRDAHVLAWSGQDPGVPA